MSQRKEAAARRQHNGTGMRWERVSVRLGNSAAWRGVGEAPYSVATSPTRLIYVWWLRAKLWPQSICVVHRTLHSHIVHHTSPLLCHNNPHLTPSHPIPLFNPVPVTYISALFCSFFCDVIIKTPVVAVVYCTTVCLCSIQKKKLCYSKTRAWKQLTWEKWI